MGAGSSVSASLKKAREDEEVADKIFSDIDANKDGVLSVVELYDAATKYGEAIGGDWSLDNIKEAIDKFDENGDGKLDLQEFKHALTQMEDKKRKKKASLKTLKSSGGSNKNLKAVLKRSFTWKKIDMATIAQDALDAEAEEEAAAAPAGAPSAGVMAEAIAAPLTEEERMAQRRAQFWARQDTFICWQVPFQLNRDKMPWLADHETGMEVAMARARSLQKTPLLVDDGFEKMTDQYFASKGDAVCVLEAKNMFNDERNGVRNHDTVMNDTRKLLVTAMREGWTFHIKLEEKVTDFAGGVYTDESTFPLAIFDQRVADSLLEHYTAAAPPPPGLDVESWSALWKSEHPFAKVLREPDLDPKGRFFVGAGFNVVVSTYMKVDDYVGNLRNSMPLGRLQGIKPLYSPV